MQDEPQARRLVSSRVANFIVELSILAECQLQVSPYRPWASTFENQAASRDRQLKNDFLKRTSALQEIMAHTKAAPLTSTGDVSDKRFYYPVDKRKTRENTEAMQAAERNLDDFCAKWDQPMSLKTSISSILLCAVCYPKAAFFVGDRKSVV